MYGWAQVERDRADELNLLRRNRYPSGHPAHLLFKTCVPRVYQSIAEIDEWRTNFEACVKEIEESEFTPMDGLFALRYLSTFGLAYQQQNDRALMSRLWSAILDKIHRPFFPAYSQPIPRKRQNHKLRVGYISEHMGINNGSAWALGWMENHGVEFEVNAFNLSVWEDALTPRFKAASRHYFKLGKSLSEDIAVIAAQKLDVLIYTDIGLGAATAYFAGLRLAPVQCTAWGHPITSGFPTIDYYLSSEAMEPADADDHYQESLVRLPGIGMCFESRIGARSKKNKADFGLDDGQLYLSCQSLMKYLPQNDRVFARIAELTERPIVFMSGYNQVLTEATRDRMRRAGVNSHWLPQMSTEDFHRVQELAEVSIDSIGWSGGNTTLDSLALGVPVVTLAGEFMRGRHSSAFLNHCGAPGLIAKDESDFIDLAVNKPRRTEALAAVDPASLFGDKEGVRQMDQWMLSLFE